ncbi:hypothetical protein C2E21_1683 [Chlorella sorokiniana]|uniref:Uncharacterized protein n=1 Tax=Chlorella sorokiniana TaxID=3076 RepID=A0A2P6U0Y0_CHLSO|nr:hypothetical protein C2E21_1683 [Chlorella sorokiniana]|eukprot:PRW59971.1 hypothetical protein C2E21_1683 [Chlorella sorokiniana]
MDRHDQTVEGVAVQRAGAGGKRVHAPALPRAPPPPTTPLGVWRRELQGGVAREARPRAFPFCRLLREWDPFVQEEVLSRPIHEVLAAQGLVLVLSISGVCTAYDQDSNEPLCFLNVAADEMVRSLFVDHPAGALITVSTFGSDPLHVLKVRSTPLSAIRAGRKEAWRPLFESEVLRYPGFVEFDDVSNLVITFSAESGLFKLWELRNLLAPRFQISSQEVRDVKVAAGALLLFMDPGPERANDLRLRVLDLVHGDCVLEDMWLPMWLPGIPANNMLGISGMEVVELFGLYLLTKQTGGPLYIRHILTGAVKEVPRAAFATPSAFIFLPFNNTFLTFYKRADAQLWDFEGNCLATLKGAWLPSSSAASTVHSSSSSSGNTTTASSSSNTATASSSSNTATASSSSNSSSSSGGSNSGG